MSEAQKTFSGSREDMYAIAEIGWQNCQNYLARFQSFKAKYTDDFISTSLAAIHIAKELPNVSARQAQITSKRTKVAAAAKECCRQWQVLATYIDDSFSKDQLTSMRKLAGYSYYTGAANKDWNAVENLLAMASAFIITHTAELNAGGMPEAFTTAFATSKVVFEKALKNYKNLKNDLQSESNAKAEASSAIFAIFSNMLKDAKVIFKDEPNIVKLFTYNALAKRVTKKGKGGFRITVKDAITHTPVTTTTFVFMPGNISAFVNGEGVAEVYLAKGSYSYTATTPGYDSIVDLNLQADAGVIHRLEILLGKAVAVA